MNKYLRARKMNRKPSSFGFESSENSNVVTAEDGWAPGGYFWDQAAELIKYVSPDSGQVVQVKKGTSAYSHLTGKLNWKASSEAKMAKTIVPKPVAFKPVPASLQVPLPPVMQQQSNDPLAQVTEHLENNWMWYAGGVFAMVAGLVGVKTIKKLKKRKGGKNEDTAEICQDCLMAGVNGDLTGLDYHLSPQEADKRAEEIRQALHQFGHFAPTDEVNEFSTSACECCGDRLAGQRYTVILMNNEGSSNMDYWIQIFDRGDDVDVSYILSDDTMGVVEKGELIGHISLAELNDSMKNGTQIKISKDVFDRLKSHSDSVYSRGY